MEVQEAIKRKLQKKKATKEKIEKICKKVRKKESSHKGVSGMNILNIEHVSKIYGEKTIFDDASFGIHEGEKIGIIGINGTGARVIIRPS